MEQANPNIPKISFEDFINDTMRDTILESFKSNGMIIVTGVPRL
jgi:hypothetical protein